MPNRGRPLESVALVSNSSWYLFNFRLDFALELKKFGVEAVFIAPQDKFSEEIQKAGFRWVEWKIERKSLSPLSAFSSIRQLQKIYQGLKPSLVHHFTPKAVFWGSIAAKVAGIRNIVNSVTGLGHLAEDRGLSSRFLFAIEKKLYRLAIRTLGKAVVFQNDEDRAQFLEWSLCEKDSAFLIRGSGINLKRFSPKSDLKVESPVVLFASRLLEAKGIREFLEAAIEVKKSRPDVRFQVIGDRNPGNPTSVSLAALEELAAQGVIEVFGHQNPIDPFIASSSIVVLPSWREGLPRILLEASAMERPVIASDVPGCRDVVVHGETGLLVAPRNANALAIAIRRLLEDQDLARSMGEKGRIYVEKNFSIGQIAARTLDLYRNITGCLPGWRVRDGTLADEEGVRALFYAAFGKSLSSQEWAWMFRESPFVPPIVVVAESEDKKIIGQYALVPLPVRWSGKQEIACLSVQSMIHPSFQRQGILRELVRRGEERLRQEKIHFGITFLNDNSLPAYVNHFGWQPKRGGLPVYVVPPLLSTFIAGIVKMIPSSISGRERFGWVAIESGLIFDSRVEALWMKFSRNIRFCTERNLAYLKWRLAKRPVGYQILRAERNGLLLGFVAFRCEPKFGIRLGYIVELIFDPEFADTGFLLVGAAIKALRENRCTMVSALMANSDLVKTALRMNGFFRMPGRLMPHGVHFCLREREQAVTSAEAADDYFLSWSDHDVP